MGINFLEELASEYYEIRGFLIRRNVPTGKGLKRGDSNEIDLLALCPKNQELLHVETDSVGRLKDHLPKKFRFNKADYEKILGVTLSREPRRIAISGAGRGDKKKIENVGLRWPVYLVPWPTFITKIIDFVRTHYPDPMKKVIPENYALLRTIQFVLRSERKKP